MGVWRSGTAAWLACSVITSEDLATECTPPSCEVRPHGIQRDTWRIYNGRRDTRRIYNGRRDTWRTGASADTTRGGCKRAERPNGAAARRRPTCRVAHVAAPRVALRTLVHVSRRAWSASFTWLRTRVAR